MEITIKRKKLTIQGDGLAFSVPKAYIDNGQISREKEYDLVIKEVDTNGNNTGDNI